MRIGLSLQSLCILTIYLKVGVQGCVLCFLNYFWSPEERLNHLSPAV